MDQKTKSKFPTGLFFIIVILVGLSASILLTQKQYSETEAPEPLFTEAENADLDLPESNPQTVFQSLINQGDNALISRNFSRALSYYISAYRINPDALDPFLKIINVYLITENYPLALKNIELASNRAPNNPEVTIAQIRYNLAQNNIAGATSAAISIDPPTTKINLYKAIVSIAADDHENAQKVLNSLSGNINDTNLANTAQKIINSYELFSTFESGSEAYLDTLLGQNLLSIGEYKLARDLFYRAIAVTNDYRDAWIGLGYSFLQVKNYEQADQALDRAKKIDPYKAETYFYQGLSAEEQNNNKRALGLLTQAKNYEYSRPLELAEHLATNYYALKEYDKAIGHFENVLFEKKVPINFFVSPIWIHLEQTKNLDQALKIAQRAQELYPENAETFNYLGWVQLYRKEYDAAKENLTQAISRNPQLAAAYLNFGLLFKEQGKLEGSLPYLVRAAELAKITKDDSIRERALKEQALIQNQINKNQAVNPIPLSN